MVAAAGLANVKVLSIKFLCDGQGTVRRAILYADWSCLFWREKTVLELKKKWQTEYIKVHQHLYQTVLLLLQCYKMLMV